MAVVGFRITSLNGYDKEAIEYIRKVCILSDASIAKNIVAECEKGINIFSFAIDEDELSSIGFDYELIETQDDKYMVISNTNFILELQYNGSLVRLEPTEYIYVETAEVSQFEEYIKQELVKTIPEYFDYCQEWILDYGAWNDNAIWIDTRTWKDTA